MVHGDFYSSYPTRLEFVEIEEYYRFRNKTKSQEIKDLEVKYEKGIEEVRRLIQGNGNEAIGNRVLQSIKPTIPLMAKKLLEIRELHLKSGGKHTPLCFAFIDQFGEIVREYDGLTYRPLSATIQPLDDESSIQPVILNYEAPLEQSGFFLLKDLSVVG